MSSVESQQVISVSSVRKALDNLICTSTRRPPSELEKLLLVSTHMKRYEFPDTTEFCQYALSKVLTDVITRRFTELCVIFGLDIPSIKESYSESLNTMATCTQLDSLILMAWCWIYYRYVRPELPITPIEFSRICQINPRTLRRYQQVAVAQLTGTLIEAEWKEIQRRN